LIANRHLGSERQLVPHMVTRGACLAHAHDLYGRYGHEIAWTEVLARVEDSRTEADGGREAVNLQTIADALWQLRFDDAHKPLVDHHEAAKAQQERDQRARHNSNPLLTPAPVFA
jgi:hypothetical protein